MIQTIHIGHLLRETVASPYRNLVTRPTGAAIRNRIQEAMAGSDCLTALLDFSGIELLDFSCADEVVAKLLLDDAERGRPVRGPAGTARGPARGDRARAHPPPAGRGRADARATSTPSPRLLGWVTRRCPRGVRLRLRPRRGSRAGELAARARLAGARAAEAALATLALPPPGPRRRTTGT